MATELYLSPTGFHLENDVWGETSSITCVSMHTGDWRHSPRKKKKFLCGLWWGLEVNWS